MAKAKDVATATVEDAVQGYDDAARLTAFVVQCQSLLEVGTDYRDYVKRTGRLSAPGLGLVAGLVEHADRALQSLQSAQPTLFGLPAHDRHAEALREAERALKLATARLAWTKDLQPGDVVGSHELLVTNAEHDARNARNRLHQLKGEPLEAAPATDTGGGFTLPEWLRPQRREPKPPPQLKDFA